MNSADLQIFNQAVATAQSGQTQAAHATLTSLNQRYPTDTNVLLWMAFTASNWNTASAYIEKVAQFEPNNPSLAGARQWLASQKPLSSPVESIGYPNFEVSGTTPGNNIYSNPSGYEAFPGATMPSQAYNPADASISQGAKVTKSRKPWLMVMAAVIVVLLIAITVVVVLNGSNTTRTFGTTGTTKTPGTTATFDIPAPPNGRSITLDGFLDGVLKQLQESQVQSTQDVIKNSQTAYYAVPNGMLSGLSTFYTQQMTGRGWSAATISIPTNNLTVAQLYTKDTKSAAILMVGPVTAQDLLSVPAELNDKFKAGDVLVIVIEFDKNNAKGIGS